MNFEIKEIRIIGRPWGMECQFSAYVEEINDYIIDSVILDDENEDPTEKIEKFVENRLNIMEEELENSLGISKVDEELIRVKDDLKVFGVTQMKMNPQCTEEEYLNSFYEVFEDFDASMAKKLLNIYINNAFVDGYIQIKSFEAFRDWVIETPVEILMGI